MTNSFAIGSDVLIIVAAQQFFETAAQGIGKATILSIFAQNESSCAALFAD